MSNNKGRSFHMRFTIQNHVSIFCRTALIAGFLWVLAPLSFAQQASAQSVVPTQTAQSSQTGVDTQPGAAATTSKLAPVAAATSTGSANLAAELNNKSTAQNAGSAGQAQAFDGANTAWLLICTVLVMLMTMPGIILFYSGMLRTKNALSIVAHTVCAAAVITLLWAVIGYSLAFTDGNGFFGGLDRAFAEKLIGAKVGAHPLAPSVPEPVFFMFQLAFAIIAFALVLGSTAERMRLGATVVFAILWLLAVYAPIAHWIWQPTGWLAKMGHMDFAGGTVVHIVSGVTGLVAALVVGPRRGFGKEPMVPHNLLITVLGAGLLWAGWFGFNAGSAFEASGRAAGALLATQVAACVGAFVWGLFEYVRRGQMSVLGIMTGAIAGLIAITPASGYVGLVGALSIGAIAGGVCFVAVTTFKAMTGIDDTLDVFALHGVGGILGTVLTPVFALPEVAPVTATVITNVIGALAVIAYTAVATFVVLMAVKVIAGLRVDAEEEKTGLDLAQHGEMIAQS
jgi:Amt family ammonium transporter